MEQMLELVQQTIKPSQILRATKCKQHFGGGLSSGDRERFCALGAIFHGVFGWDGNQMAMAYHNYKEYWNEIGLTTEIQHDINHMNDDLHWSFQEIADKLEYIGL